MGISAFVRRCQQKTCAIRKRILGRWRLEQRIYVSGGVADVLRQNGAPGFDHAGDWRGDADRADHKAAPIHETGHLLFRPFGQFMMVAGGSLFQVIMPAIFVAYFVWQRSFYSAAVVLLWVGQSLINVYIYAADAVVMRLVLTSGLTGSEGSFHDWNYLLTTVGLLGSTKTVAGIIRLLGTFTIIAGGILSVYYSFLPDEPTS